MVIGFPILKVIAAQQIVVNHHRRLKEEDRIHTFRASIRGRCNEFGAYIRS